MKMFTSSVQCTETNQYLVSLHLVKLARNVVPWTALNAYLNRATLDIKDEQHQYAE
jgi:hypothetical protein